ncbi:protease inhibitor I42 family protein [Tatumella citrea]|uniref:Proteinase inhibitor I42 chagasin domain-containing protein n=1 Tax=Tatumella citrea TaxID=53336 RepID=A0A1Y0L4T6_TATCI|nr:protease inhibitor I42 family protein [Tatumella citrea]ARU93021.1 hypothetical protein A7K98_03930 [Tatumella citrea]ARU97059.1 hypothetical protein A7K99_03930 [Tatumella citrea]
MNRFISCLAVALSCMSVAAVAAETPAQLNGVAGKPILLTLDASPTTGYQWMVSQLPSGLLLIPGSYRQSPDCKSGMVGCSGQQTFYLIGRKAGTSTLKMIYGRTFDSADWLEKSIRVVISAVP